MAGDKYKGTILPNGSMAPLPVNKLDPDSGQGGRATTGKYVGMATPTGQLGGSYLGASSPGKGNSGVGKV